MVSAYSDASLDMLGLSFIDRRQHEPLLRVSQLSSADRRQAWLKHYRVSRPVTTCSASTSSATTSAPKGPQPNILDQLMSIFNQQTQGASKPASAAEKEYIVAITGATGMIGTALRQALAAGPINGRQVRVQPISRSGDGNVTVWDPASGTLDPAALEGVDAVIHLAGENVGSGSAESLQARLGAWTDKKKSAILESRRDGTALLATTIAGLKTPPQVFVTASAVGYYGYDTGETTLDEGTGRGKGFLAEVADVWEKEASKARDRRGPRIVNARFGVVLSKKGGIIAKLLPIFQLGGGGIIGDGKQYLSWISLQDAVKALKFILETPSLSGPVNVVAPQPVTNQQFTEAMGKATFRPTFIPLPAGIASTVFGEMGHEMLLGGQRAIPRKLDEAGFRFEYPDIQTAIIAALEE